MRTKTLFKLNKVKMAKSTIFVLKLFYMLFSQEGKPENVTSDSLSCFPGAFPHDCLQSMEAYEIPGV